MNELFFALWFFLPAGIANATPVFLNKIPVLNRWNTPMDFGKSYRGKRISGDNKKWRGLVGGAFVATLVVLLQHYLATHYQWDITRDYLDYTSPHVWLLGSLLGTGALLGDAVESFFKRQRDVAPGNSWFPFDQVDYIIGGCLFSLLYTRLPAEVYAYVFAFWFIAHLLVSYIGYLLRLKDTPI